MTTIGLGDWSIYTGIRTLVFCPDCTIAYAREGVECSELELRMAWDLATQPGGLFCDECGKR